jgi:catechol 2,3-dioxygenase-like lactoylglutathione lyase family enzyme
MISRIIAYADAGRDLAESRRFYVSELGLEVAMETPVLGLRSASNPTAQIIIPPRGMENPVPRFGIDLRDPEQVGAVHAKSSAARTARRPSVDR